VCSCLLLECFSRESFDLQVVSVQYQVVDSQISDDSNTDSLKLAFYKLTNPHRQITSCVLPLCQHCQVVVFAAECVLCCYCRVCPVYHNVTLMNSSPYFNISA
jgi:hypothetical protein